MWNPHRLTPQGEGALALPKSPLALCRSRDPCNLFKNQVLVCVEGFHSIALSHLSGTKYAESCTFAPQATALKKASLFERIFF